MLRRMATMTRRLQILMDEDRYQLLDRESQHTGKPIAELIRDAIDHMYGIDRTERHAALERLLAAEPMPVEDWDSMKQDMMDSMYKLIP